MFLGDKIRELREAQSPPMSQERLAQIAGTSTRTINRIETRRVTPHPATLARIAVALGVSPDFFGLYVEVRRKIKRTDGRLLRNRELVA